MRLRSLSLSSVAVILVGLAFGDVKIVGIGEPAPPIHVQSFVPEQPLDTTIAGFKGKAMVLEFWATWCGPCVEAIGHLNELADQFAGKPVQFLSVTDEDFAVVEKFLKKRPIHGLVGIDRENVMAKAYGFGGAVPQTVLISADGKVAIITQPSVLRASDIEELLAERAPSAMTGARPAIVTEPVTVRATGPAPLLEMLVQRSTGTSHGMSTGRGILQAQGFTLRDLLARVYEMPGDAVIGEPVEDSTRYDVSLAVPGANPAEFRQLLPQLFCMTFHVATTRETRDVEGWILKAPNGKPAALAETDTGGVIRTANGELSMVGMPISALAMMVRSVVHKPVVDKTGLSGKYDLKVTFDKQRPESLLDALRGLGFTLEPGVVSTEFLVVTKH